MWANYFLLLFVLLVLLGVALMFVAKWSSPLPRRHSTWMESLMLGVRKDEERPKAQ